MEGMPWTSEQDGLLRTILADGGSYSDVAAAVGRTRGAVTSRAEKLDVKSRQNRDDAGLVARIIASKRNRQRTLRSTQMAPHHYTPREVSVAPPKMLNLLELGNRTCRWPYGDPGEPGFGFCGHRTVSGKPYCRAHQSIAVVKGTQRDIDRLASEPMPGARAA
jgi:GcrA cell cycle regulator